MKENEKVPQATIKYLGQKKAFCLNLPYLECTFDDNSEATVNAKAAQTLVADNPTGFRIMSQDKIDGWPSAGDLIEANDIILNAKADAADIIANATKEAKGIIAKATSEADTLLESLTDPEPKKTGKDITMVKMDLSKSYKTMGTAAMVMSKKAGVSADTHEIVETKDGFVIAAKTGK